MKLLLPFLVLFFSLFIHQQAYAIQPLPTFFCVGGSLKPPCATLAPTHPFAVSPTPLSPSAAVTNNPSLAPTIAQNPCVTQSSAVTIKAEKMRRAPNGLISRFILFLFRFFLMLLEQLLGGAITIPVPPMPTPGTISPSPIDTSPVPSGSPCPQPSTAVSIAPSGGAIATPTIFGTNPSPTLSGQPTIPPATNCTPNAILVNPCHPWFGAAAKGNSNAAADAISQFTYLEKLIGHPMDVFHDYNPAGSVPLNSDELHFAQRANTYIFVNWKPAGNWADAGGGNATVNANIDKAAKNIKAIAPKKIFLTVWHEPENDVTPGTSNCPNLKGHAGSPAQYRAMWQNVENRFKAAGVTNVVWVMDYQGYEPFDCLKPQMWPGNSLVDWVAYDTYGTDAKSNWNDSVGRVYKLLQQDQNSTTDFASKPWAVAEYGTCNMASEQNAYTYYKSAKTALDANSYPNIKMYLIYASTGNSAGPGCLTNFTKTGASDPQKQTLFNQFANDPIFLKK